MLMGDVSIVSAVIGVAGGAAELQTAELRVALFVVVL